MNLDPGLAAILGAVVAAGATLFTLRVQRRKIDAEGTGILVGASVDLVTKLVEQVGTLEGKVRDLEGKVRSLEEERTIDRELVGMLTQQLQDADLVPTTRRQARQQLGIV